MTLRADFQPLIDWCTAPSGGLHVANANLSSYLLGRSEAGGHAYWDGWLFYWRMIPRRLGWDVEAHEYPGAVFSGVLRGVSDAHVWLTVADDGAWLSLQGPGGLGKEWLEGVPVDRGDPTLPPNTYYPGPMIGGEKPEDFHAWIRFPGADRVFNLVLTIASYGISPWDLKSLKTDPRQRRRVES